MRCAVLCALMAAIVHAAPQFQIRFSEQARSTPVDGRLILVVSKETKGEPRFQVTWGLETQQIFGVDVDDLKPGQSRTIDASAAGHPLKSLTDLPAGDYNIQAVLNVYETVRRADGHVLKLPMDNGEGQQWNRSPGNLYSKPKTVHVGPDSAISVELTEVIPPIDPPRDTKYIRHVRIQSDLLTKFWGRPTHVGAIVLIPPGFDDHPDQRYPIAFHQGHFPPEFPYFRETPPAPETKGRQRDFENWAHRFFQEWSSGRLPKMLVVLTQHATPFYDDSYGVNTANMGPYGDALTTELYPYIEKQFRAIGEPWARVLYGGSTGGWMTLAQQIFYPDYFGGAWGFCPDPVDFHAFQLINVYSEKNAYYDIGPFSKMPKPLGRMSNDHVLSTMEDFSRQESVLGTKGRSGGQMDAFHAVFGPVGKDGYPAKLWDADTGEINPEVARYWREHSISQRCWNATGNALAQNSSERFTSPWARRIRFSWMPPCTGWKVFLRAQRNR